MSFAIKISDRPALRTSDLQEIAVEAEGTYFTRLLRADTRRTSNFVKARPAQLAFWLVDNWWRLRWESLPVHGVDAEWRMSHDVSSLGGTAWPRLYMWGDGERVGICSFKDPVGVVGPVQFLDDSFKLVPALDWEKGTDSFLTKVTAERSWLGSDHETLVGLLQQLLSERADDELSAWRRLEARLGYNPDQAPDELMDSLFAIASRYDAAGVEEASQATQGLDAASILTKEIEAARSSRLQCDFKPALAIAANTDFKAGENIWTPAERAARAVRDAANRAHGPLRNAVLSDILGVTKNSLQSSQTAPAQNLPYGLRLADGSRDVVALKTRRSQSRRFELARALGDVIWTSGSPLGPLTKAKTHRQQFQRNFAQSLLCPIDDLQDYLGTDPIDEDSVEAAAEHFHVNRSLVVRTLQKKRVIAPDSFEHMVEAA